jgi:hypothetical protein
MAAMMATEMQVRLILCLRQHALPLSLLDRKVDFDNACAGQLVGELVQLVPHTSLIGPQRDVNDFGGLIVPVIESARQ